LPFANLTGSRLSGLLKCRVKMRLRRDGLVPDSPSQFPQTQRSQKQPSRTSQGTRGGQSELCGFVRSSCMSSTVSTAIAATRATSGSRLLGVRAVFSRVVRRDGAVRRWNAHCKPEPQGRISIMAGTVSLTAAPAGYSMLRFPRVPGGTDTCAAVYLEEETRLAEAPL
jgi:hypothetical protein